MINNTALINQHIYENGLYLSEDRQAEIRHKSESKSGNLVESRRKINLIDLDKMLLEAMEPILMIQQKRAMDEAAQSGRIDISTIIFVTSHIGSFSSLQRNSSGIPSISFFAVISVEIQCLTACNAEKFEAGSEHVLNRGAFGPAIFEDETFLP
ncbi:hypothetical protein PPACK8108_LOCUS16800 [Phakopsora pachyrhizi]|uniref:Uncharacterized protein n=1 Tax=Phakopsora pachyrhizi TaxID=170000 RepID=A0AAV0BDJ8_PHAPC|nr:hypothetical protein PPACK8108_LOCUS16800 [Phakopsora pachyrhizi]